MEGGLSQWQGRPSQAAPLSPPSTWPAPFLQLTLATKSHSPPLFHPSAPAATAVPCLLGSQQRCWLLVHSAGEVSHRP